MKGIAQLVLFGLMVCAGGIVPAAVKAAVIQEHHYKLWSHPDGSASPPTYGLRLDGIEWFATGGDMGGSSDTWTFDFTNMSATYTYNNMGADTLRIFGTAVGGRDLSGGSYDQGQSAEVTIDFTYTGYNGRNSHTDPEFHVYKNGGSGPSSNGTGFIRFEDSIFGIAEGTSIDLLAWGNNSGNLFNFDSDPAPGYRLEDYCGGGGNQPAYCGMPVGWGWLALKDKHWIHHTSHQDWLFVSKKKTQRVPEPATLPLLVAGIGLFSLMSVAGSRRRRSDA